MNLPNLEDLAGQIAAGLPPYEGRPWLLVPVETDERGTDVYRQLSTDPARRRESPCFSLAFSTRQHSSIDPRLCVSGVFQHFHGSDHVWGNESRPRISLDPLRPADSLARDIARRFLPAYLTLWETTQGRIADTRRYHNESAALLRLLCAEIGVLRPTALKGGETDPPNEYRETHHATILRVQIHARPDSVALMLENLTRDRALLLLGVIHEWNIADHETADEAEHLARTGGA